MPLQEGFNRDQQRNFSWSTSVQVWTLLATTIQISGYTVDI